MYHVYYATSRDAKGTGVSAKRNQADTSIKGLQALPKAPLMPANTRHLAILNYEN